MHFFYNKYIWLQKKMHTYRDAEKSEGYLGTFPNDRYAFMYWPINKTQSVENISLG